MGVFIHSKGLFPQYSCDLMRDGHISVLVIEDEADIRQLLRTLLEREGFACPRRTRAETASANSSRAIPTS